jgi:hypothetical protein
MKKILVLLFVLLLVGGLAWSQEAKKPVAALSFLLGGSIIAPLGVGAEFFVGPVGIGAELRGLFLAVEGSAVGTLEPGAYVHFYFSELESSLYLMGGLSYLTAWGVGDGSSGVVEAGILKPKAGVGYNALFGKNDRIRFAAEVGAVYMAPMVSGDITEDIPFLLLPHVMIMFGGVF